MFEIKNMSRKDLDIAVEWAANEGWNPGLYDADVFYATDPKGFFMAWDNNEPIGAISAVRYPGGDFGFIGFFIVTKVRRGGMVGPALGEAALKHLEGCNVGQDGVLAKVKNYQAAGFKLAYRNYRYAGMADGRGITCSNIQPVSGKIFAAICLYDRDCFPANREVFLEKWFSQLQTQTLVYLEDGVRGYGVIRKCREGFKIGPLFADDQNIAERLFLKLTEGKAGEQIFLDVPEKNRLAIELAEKHALRPVFATARMYSKVEPELALDKIFGVTTFELG